MIRARLIPEKPSFAFVMVAPLHLLRGREKYKGDQVSGFIKASDLPIGTTTRIEDLELLLNQKDARIAELEAENETLRETDAPARPQRPSSEVLKDSERLILLCRINDLTVANLVLEGELRKSMKTAEENIGILFSLVAKLKPTTQPLQIDRGKQLIGLIISNNGRMPSQEARQIMHISKQSFSNLLETLPQVESRPMKTDKRRRLLVLK
jgi:hypothetical protein